MINGCEYKECSRPAMRAQGNARQRDAKVFIDFGGEVLYGDT